MEKADLETYEDLRQAGFTPAQIWALMILLKSK